MINKNFFVSILLIVVGIFFGITIMYYTPSKKEENKPNNAISNNSLETLLTIDSRGGLCPYGECNSKIEIRENSSYTYKFGDGKEVVGELLISDVNNLAKLIKKEDFVSIKSKKFTGTCPTAYDGQELIYTFFPSKETISSCTYAISGDSPLFKLIGSLLSAIYSKL